MNHLCLVSVIIPVYNAQAYLDVCMTGVINQSYHNLEILLIDDGSTDQSGALCDKWAETDSRVKVIHKENGGQADARNVALDICHGVYIVFVDADDCVHPELVAYLHQLLTEHCADLAICEYRYLTDCGSFLNHFQDDGKIMCFSQKQALCELCDDTRFSSSPWAKMFRKEAFADIRFPVGHIFEDLGTVYKLFLKSNQVVFGQRALYDYMLRQNSTMTSVFQMRKLDAAFYAEEMCRTIVGRWPELEGIAQKRLFKEYAYCLRCISLSKEQTPEMKRAFHDLYLKLKATLPVVGHGKLTPKLRGYFLCACVGEPALKVGFHLENRLYSIIKLKKLSKGK